MFATAYPTSVDALDLPWSRPRTRVAPALDPQRILRDALLLEVLSKHFAVSVCGFAILDNHLHVLCRLDSGVAAGWTDEDVVRRWIASYHPSCLDVDNPAAVQSWIDHQCRDTIRMARPGRRADRPLGGGGSGDRRRLVGPPHPRGAIGVGQPVGRRAGVSAGAGQAASGELVVGRQTGGGAAAVYQDKPQRRCG